MADIPTVLRFAAEHCLWMGEGDACKDEVVYSCTAVSRADSLLNPDASLDPEARYSKWRNNPSRLFVEDMLRSNIFPELNREGQAHRQTWLLLLAEYATTDLPPEEL